MRRPTTMRWPRPRAARRGALFWIPPYVEGVPARRGSIDVRPSVWCPTLEFFDTFCVFLFGRAFEQFKEAINDEDFEDLLKDAQDDPKGVAAQDLLKEVLTFLSIQGRQVPWGSVKRNTEVTKLMAEHRWYGPGSHFVNLAPDDVHNPSAVRLCVPLICRLRPSSSSCRRRRWPSSGQRKRRR